MNRKRNPWIFIGIMILVTALVSGFLLMQPSAEDILVQTLETVKTITDGHAVVAIDVDTIEQDASGNVEVDSPQYTAKTDRLEYDVKAQILELSGKDSKITMGKNSITGSKITYYRAEERFKVEGGSDKRVNAVFFSDGKVSDMFGDEKSEAQSKEESKE